MWLATLYVCSIWVHLPCNAASAFRVETMTIKADSEEDCKGQAYRGFNIQPQLKSYIINEIICARLQS